MGCDSGTFPCGGGIFEYGLMRDMISFSIAPEISMKKTKNTTSTCHFIRTASSYTIAFLTCEHKLSSRLVDPDSHRTVNPRIYQ